MEIYLAVTIDTECDKGPNWKVKQPLGFRSVLEGVPQKFQPLFEKLGIKPTYLLSPEMIEHDGCVATLKQCAGKCEFGTHLHGEFVEPNRPPVDSVVATNDMQLQYSSEVERAKLENLSRCFEARFGYKATSFRAGRFGIGKNSLKILDDLGYLVDSSVTPYAIHDDLHFWGCPTSPYHPAETDPSERGKLRILEAPVTIHSPFLSSLPQTWLRRQRPSAFWFRAARKLLGREFVRAIWLRPSFRDVADMRRVIYAHLAAARGKKRALLVMMFHSVEVIPAASPYAKTEEDVVVFLKRLEEVLTHCSQMGARSIGLSEAAQLEWE